MMISQQCFTSACAFLLTFTVATALRPSMDAARLLTQKTPEWKIHQDIESTRTLMAKAFASGEPVVDWLVRDMEMPSESDMQQRLDAYKFCMSFPIREGLSEGGLVLGKTGEDEMECGILFREYDPKIDGKKSKRKAVKATVRSLRTYFGMGKGRKVGPFQGFFSQQTQSYFNKGAFYDAISSKFHSKYGPTSPHWYITSVGVDPASQGKGHGKKLMGQMGALADEVGMDVYLECAGVRNKYFYEKMGFEEVGMEVLDDGKGDAVQEIYLMIRPNNQAVPVVREELLA